MTVPGWLSVIPVHGQDGQGADAAAGTQDQTTRQATPEQVQQWIRELDDDRFHVREAATRRLSELDASAIPALEQAAAEGSMEVTIRAIAVMRKIGGRDDQSSERVHAALARLSQPDFSLAGEHAKRALQELVVIDGERAREFLLSLGANYGTGVNTGEGIPTPAHLEFRKEWRGSLDDFRRIRQVQDLDRLTLIGSKFTDEVVPDILNLDGLDALDLYGTKISASGQQIVKEKFRGELDIRAGAKLGVQSRTGQLQCMIDLVVPGSAADRGGIRANDVVIRCDGQDVNSFQKLTDIISEKSPGESLDLVIMRGNNLVRLKVELGEW